MAHLVISSNCCRAGSAFTTAPSSLHTKKLDKVSAVAVKNIPTLDEAHGKELKKKVSSEFTQSEKLNKEIYDELVSFYGKFRAYTNRISQRERASEWIKEFIEKFIDESLSPKSSQPNQKESAEKEETNPFPEPFFKACFEELSRINEKIKKYKISIAKLKNGEFATANQNLELTIIGLKGAIEIESLNEADGAPNSVCQLNTPVPVCEVTFVSCKNLSHEEYERGMMDISNLSICYVHDFVDYMYFVKLANYGLKSYVRQIKESTEFRLFEALKFAKEIGEKFAPQPALKNLEVQEGALQKKVLDFDKYCLDYMKTLDCSDETKIQNATLIVFEIAALIQNKMAKVTKALLESRAFINPYREKEKFELIYCEHNGDHLKSSLKKAIPDEFLDKVMKEVSAYCAMVEKLPDYICQLIHLKILLAVLEQFNPNILLLFDKIKNINVEIGGLTQDDDYLFPLMKEVCAGLQTYSSAQVMFREIADIQLELSREGNDSNLQLIQKNFAKIMVYLPKIFPYANA